MFNWSLFFELATIANFRAFRSTFSASHRTSNISTSAIIFLPRHNRLAFFPHAASLSSILRIIDFNASNTILLCRCIRFASFMTLEKICFSNFCSFKRSIWPSTILATFRRPSRNLSAFERSILAAIRCVGLSATRFACRCCRWRSSRTATSCASSRLSRSPICRICKRSKLQTIHVSPIFRPTRSQTTVEFMSERK